jgi:hypothetical protein
MLNKVVARHVRALLPLEDYRPAQSFCFLFLRLVDAKNAKRSLLAHFHQLWVRAPARCRIAVGTCKLSVRPPACPSFQLPHRAFRT